MQTLPPILRTSPEYSVHGLLDTSRVVICCPCGRVARSAAMKCPSCGSEVTEQDLHRGEIYSLTTSNLGEKAFVLALVQLSNGSLVMGQITNTLGDLKIGTTVTLEESKTKIPLKKGIGGMVLRWSPQE